MLAYKGFKPDLSCSSGGNTFQYKVGVLNETDQAKCSRNGFHCAEDPLDVLAYYSNWENSVYYIVDALGDINEDGDDSKISCTQMRLLKKLTLEQFVMESLIYMSNHPLRNTSSLYVATDRGTSNNLFIIVRGKAPIAKGKIGTYIGFAQETPENKEIEIISVYYIDGEKFKPDIWYSISGEPLMEEES